MHYDRYSLLFSLPRFLRCSHTHSSSSNKQNDYEIWLLDVLKQNFFQVAERKQAAGTVTKERNEEFSATTCFSTSSSLFSMHCHYQSHNNNNEKRNWNWMTSKCGHLQLGNWVKEKCICHYAFCESSDLEKFSKSTVYYKTAVQTIILFCQIAYTRRWRWPHIMLVYTRNCSAAKRKPSTVARHYTNAILQCILLCCCWWIFSFHSFDDDVEKADRFVVAVNLIL